MVITKQDAERFLNKKVSVFSLQLDERRDSFDQYWKNNGRVISVSDDSLTIENISGAKVLIAFSEIVKILEIL